MAKFLLSLVFAVCFSTFGCPVGAKTAVEDAIDQSSKLIRCWQPMKTEGAHVHHELSEPVYELCSYMPDPADWNKFYVNGVDENSDDYTTIKSIFASGTQEFQTLNVCLQEAFQFHASPAPSQVSFRCLCKRTGCNVPTTITKFLDANRKSLANLDY